MKKRFAEPKNHKCIQEYDFVMKHIEIEKFKGYVSLIDIKKVKEDWYVPRNDGSQVCILANNFKWVLFYPDIGNYAISALFDDKCEIVEWYIDVIKETGIENGIPFMIDLYLDLVITMDGEKYILDEDELEEALKKQDITKEEFNLAYKVLEYLLEKYEVEENMNYLREITYKYLNELLSENKEYCIN